MEGARDLEKRVKERHDALEHSQHQLLQAAKLAAIGELTRGVAHEINNPAGIILMHSACLEEELERVCLSAKGREDLAVIQRQVQKISRIVSALLAFSRQTEVELQRVDLSQLLRQVTAHIKELCQQRGMRLELVLDKAPPLIEADPGQLEQVLLNLTNNALDATPEGGVLTFTAGVDEERAGGPYAVLSVADTGKGIAPEHLARIFDPFFTTKEVGQGTGLGLAVCHGIVERHHGQIEVDSQPGQGTCFRIFLPLHASALVNDSLLLDKFL